MTDRELLELAAKAALYKFEWGKEWHNKDYPLVNGYKWKPLDYDGDALRLAVKLKLRIRIDHIFAVVDIYDSDGLWVGVVSETLEHDDPYDKTRRAIVRAAAEIGRSMK